MDEFDIKNELAGRDSVIGQNIDRYLSAMEVLGFSGAIIVNKGDEILLQKGYGLADRETRRPLKNVCKFYVDRLKNNRTIKQNRIF